MMLKLNKGHNRRIFDFSMLFRGWKDLVEVVASLSVASRLVGHHVLLMFVGVRCMRRQSERETVGKL